MDMYKIIVVEDKRSNRIVGAGSVIIEMKFNRQAQGKAGHIEDIVVDKSQRGKNLGLRIIQLLKQIAWANDCYKIVLDCADYNVPFYNKCGFYVKGVEMACYLN